MTIASSLLAFGVMPLLLLIYSSAFTNNIGVPFEAIGKFVILSICATTKNHISYEVFTKYKMLFSFGNIDQHC